MLIGTDIIEKVTFTQRAGGERINLEDIGGPNAEGRRKTNLDSRLKSAWVFAGPWGGQGGWSRGKEERRSRG